MAIRWVSNPESIKANQPSVLAIAETLAAMGVSVWIAVTWDTYIHIAIGASIAPLLLMHTDESFRTSVLVSHRLLMKVWSLAEGEIETRKFQREIQRWSRLLTYLLGVPAIFLCGRLAGAVATLLRRPAVTIAAIPGNWAHATAVLDLKKWPDVLPSPPRLPEFHDSRDTCIDAGHLIKMVRLPAGSKQGSMQFLVLAMVMVIFSLLVLPAFAYRWSLKSTAIVWFPLLWALLSVREARKPLRSFFDIYLRDPMTKILLWVSVVLVILLVGKIVVFNVQADLVDSWNAVPLLSSFSLYVTPQEIQWWQVAIVINSAIAIVMYILARRWLLRIEHDQLTGEVLPRRVFQVGLFIRKILSFYTIACTLYITIRAASEWNLPALGTKIVPWG